jgi:uncharacterized protein (UPF0262 family)
VTRITGITLDANASASPALEIERHRTISDLLCDNSFLLQTNKAAQGPYGLHLSLQSEALRMTVDCTATGHKEDISVSLAPFLEEERDGKRKLGAKHI